MAQYQDARDGPPSLRTRKRQKVSTDIETLRSIDMRPMGDGKGVEEVKHVERHREELLQNLKDNIILPLHEIKFYKIFALENDLLVMNLAIIRKLCNEAMSELKGAPELEGRETYISHLWKLIFIIPTIFNSTIGVSRSSSSAVKSRLSTTRSKASSVGKELSEVKYSATKISKKELDQMSSQMENWICEIMNEKQTTEIKNCLPGILSSINLDSQSIDCDSYQSVFNSTTDFLLVRPITVFFKFLCGEMFQFDKGGINVNKDIISGDIGVLVKPDIIVRKYRENRPLVMLKMKPSFLRIFPQGENHVLVDKDADRGITTELIELMTLSEQRFGLLMDLSTMTLVQLPIGKSNLSKIYDDIDNCIELGYTTIRTSLLERSDGITEGAEVTALNALEARTAIALVIYGNLEDKFSAARYDKPLKELAAFIKETSTQDKKTQADKNAKEKGNQGTNRRSGKLEAIHEEGAANNPVSEAYISPPSSGTPSEDEEGLVLEVDTPEKWFGMRRSSGAGDHNCDILEITKLTFTSLFKPTKAELSLLSECRGSNLIVKCWNRDSAKDYYLYNKKDIQRCYYITTSEEYLRDVIYDEYFWPEVNANLRVMKYNAAVKTKDPSAVINSPKMVKYGTIVDMRKNLFGPYIIFEALEKKDELTYERVGQLTEEQKDSIRTELNKFHSGAKMSHGDVAARNVFLDDEGVAHFIDLQRCRELTDDDPDYWIKEDNDDCETMFSNESGDNIFDIY